MSDSRPACSMLTGEVRHEDSMDDAMSGDTAINIGQVESQKEATQIENAPKKQKYTIGPRIVSDAILGLSDGLTVPFALTAGLSALGT